MAQHPQNFFWTAPTKNVDGTPITYSLDYDFEAREVGGTFAVIFTTPGHLNPDGKYTAPISDMPFFELGKSYEVGLVAVNHAAPADRSVRSNTVSFTLVDTTPQPPLDFSVA